jgi:hypothetical protein
MNKTTRDPERQRLEEQRLEGIPWKRWGPYLSERQWGTVREDYSGNGDAWNYFTHDHARSRAYHWGEDGIAGFSDDRAILCFSLAVWNGRDPIIKERLFGLANAEGNHGEDVKETYFYLDATPTHSYLRYLYKYPQEPYPYDDLVRTNRQRGKNEPEYELTDTGIFRERRYFDVFVEYAKATPEDILIRITAWNRGPVEARLHLLPHLWFRNTWSWMGGGPRPRMAAEQTRSGAAVHARHSDPRFPELADWWLYQEGTAPFLFTENETNHARLFGGVNQMPFVKDGINDWLVSGKADAVNPEGWGTKVAAHHVADIQGGGRHVVQLRLTNTPPSRLTAPFKDFAKVFAAREKEADAFHRAILPPGIEPGSERARVMRQALAGMIWGKQYFEYDVDLWLTEHGAGLGAPADRRARVRNRDWSHMRNAHVISMPDKWEYPWYAAWDLAFHAIPLAMADADFAKEQLLLMLENGYQHPNGQLPAYEWNFGDVNPPVHALAAMQVYLADKAERGGKGDLEFLELAFTRLLLNFTWWVNRKDRAGNNCFDGGFLGLDNIGIFDRSAPLPTGGYLDQADGTAWMAFFSQHMLRMAVELALHEPLYEPYVSKFFSHTLSIAAAMDRVGESAEDMWDEEDGFYYDVLRLPDGSAQRLKVRSMVGLLPLAAVSVFDEDILAKLPRFRADAKEFITRHADFCANVHLPHEPGVRGRRMLSILNEKKLRRVLARMLDEREFLGPYGIRGLSRHHLDRPFVFEHGGAQYQVRYVPGDSESGTFGGNSNWRGPVWMPVNFLIYTSLLRLYAYFGDGFTIECPTGSGNRMTLFQVAKDLNRRLTSIFLKRPDGTTPAHGRAASQFATDDSWKDLLLFYEYFHGDDGSGLGASHQTGWTGLVARLIQLDAILTPSTILREKEGALLHSAHGKVRRLPDKERV